MVLGWRRAFCTSMPNDQEPKRSTNHSSKPGSKFGFFSNPSTPQSQSQPVSRPSLRCEATSAASPAPSVHSSPKLHCKISTSKSSNSSRLFFSNPSSPKSPYGFSLLKLRISKPSKCGICLQSVKSGQGKAIFTAECSHVFHFPCIAAHVKTHRVLLCPLCNFPWKDPPILSLCSDYPKPEPEERESNMKVKTLRVYNDDEPLMLSPTSGFNPIPESNENDDEDERAGAISEFKGFFVNHVAANDVNFRKIDMFLMPDAAVVARGKRIETYAVILKVKAPLFTAARRLPLDLVTVIDVSGGGNELKLQMMKRAMGRVISFLGSSDRLSIVAFSASSKRLLPLRRMTAAGRRSARKIVDALGCNGHGMSVNDALKKAAKVLEDRRERNPAASIMVLSANGQKRFVSSTRNSHLDISVHAFSFGDLRACKYAPWEDTFAKSVSGLLSVVAQDLRLQLRLASGSGPVEISAVYSLNGLTASHKAGLVRVGDLYAEEERELLVEIKAPISSNGPRHVISVQSSYKDPSSQKRVWCKEGLVVPRPQTVKSSIPSIEWLRNLHVSTRAMAESQRLIEHNDFSGAHDLLSSARALLLKSSSKTAEEFLKGLEAELAKVQRRRQGFVPGRRQRTGGRPAEEKPEALTPTSSWRAAERLAKLAVMRKSMNRVSDLHGFENAGF